MNCVALIEAEYDVEPLKFEVLRSLEAQLGRVRTANKYADRPIDLDILLFNDAVIEQETLTIPDPDIKKRWFLAQGILDITPDLQWPATGESLQVIAQPLLDKFHASGQSFREDTNLRESILAIATPA